MKTSSNWPAGQDLGHSNHTLRFPRKSRYSGGFAPDSEKIPASGWFGLVAVAAFIFIACFAF